MAKQNSRLRQEDPQDEISTETITEPENDVLQAPTLPMVVAALHTQVAKEKPTMATLLQLIVVLLIGAGVAAVVVLLASLLLIALR